MLINKTKKDSSLCLLLELSRNYDGRIRIDVTTTPSIGQNGETRRSLGIDLLDISQSKKNLNFLTSLFPVRTLKQDCKPNLIAKSARYGGVDLLI